MKTRARSSDRAPGAMAQTWSSIAAVAVLVAAILVDHARGGELMDCEPQRVSGDGRHWAYRIIDGRACWYPGERGKPKGELRWSEAPSAPQRSGVLEQAEVEESPPEPMLDLAAAPPKPSTTEAMPGQWGAPAADQLLAFTCCWPELPAAIPLPQPGPGRRQDEPPAWPLILLPVALCAIWLIRKLASNELTGPLASDFVRSSVPPPWWRLWQGAQRKGSAVGSSSTNHRQTKLVRIDGALVPLATRGLPLARPDRRIPPAAQPRLATDEVQSTLIDRIEVATGVYASDRGPLRTI
jgi:hypothetical protein